MRHPPATGIAAAVLVAASLAAGCQPTPSPARTTVTATGVPSPVVSAEPSIEPSLEPTPEPTDSRSGVPAELADRMWFTSNGYAGTMGRDDTIKVPDDEVIVAAGAGLIVTSLETVADAGRRSALRVRTLGGDVIREIPTELIRVRAILVGTRLFYAGLVGRDVGPDEASFVDGGVWTIDLATDDPEQVIVEPGEPIDQFGANAERGVLAASPSGRTVVSRVGGFDGVRSDVIDGLELRLMDSLDENVVALTDELLFAFRETDANPRITALFIEAPGEEAWTFPTAEDGYDIFELEAVIPTDAGLAVGYHRAGEAFNEFAITLLDIESGERSDLVVNQPEDPIIDHLAEPFSAGPWVGLMPDFWDVAVQEGEPISLVDAGRRELRRDALRIVLP